MTGGVHKLRMGVRVMEALKMKQPSNKSEDLEAKIKEYDQFHQKISQLVTLLNHRHEAFLKDKETRLKVR
jgi:predicted transcriptional regulator